MALLLLGPMLRHVTSTSATLWVEVSAPARVRWHGEGLEASASTITVAGHHYALVVARGLRPGSVVRYEVELDGHRVWPPGDASTDDAPQEDALPGQSAQPASELRTPTGVGPVTIAFGSCRYASPVALARAGEQGRRPGVGGIGPDALDALARRIAADPASRPDLLLLLGDQVYADETTRGTRARIAERRGSLSEPRGEVADYEEYTWLYQESWADPEVRWLFSCVPTAMVFDDHDVHDDWNTSAAWRRDAAANPWWHERIVAALESAWVYQHLGNLSPDELDAEPTFQRLLALPPGVDGEPLLRELALAADTETGGRKGYRWSYTRDLSRTRIVVVDSRCGRVLDADRRAMISDVDFAWLAGVLRDGVAGGGYDHLVLATSLPWLLAPALHELEGWNERLAASPHPRRAALGERIRRLVDLEHWAAFGASFERLSGLLRDLASGAPGRPAPASITVLSGDVHHSYLARVRWGSDEVATPVHQVTCSPLHQAVPRPMRWTFRAGWSPAATAVARFFRWSRRRSGAAEQGFDWHRVGGGPWLGNALGTLTLDGRQAAVVLESSEGEGALHPLVRVVLTRRAR